MKLSKEDILDEARKYRSVYAGTEHLIACILKKDKKLAKGIRLSYEDFSQQILEVVGKGKKDVETTTFTPVLSMIIEDLGWDSPGSVYLNCILEEELGVGYRLLHKLGIDELTIAEYEDKIDLPKALRNNDYIINFNEKVDKNNTHIYNMDDEIDNLINNLFRVRKPNVLLVGKAGCGKTALVEGLAEKINRGAVPDWMKDKIILELIISNSIAGTRYRGDFEDRIKEILTAVAKCPQVILFIDEVHNLATAGGAEGAVPMGDIMKPYLARGDISVIGATTDKEVKAIENDKALARRFTRIDLPSMDDEKIFAILKGWSNSFEQHYHVSIEDELLRDIIRNCRREKGKSSPDRELDALEKWCLDNCNWRAVSWNLSKEENLIKN